MNIAQDINDPKAFMMQNYKEKNEILMEWDKRTREGTASSESWMSQFSEVKSNYIECFSYQIGHAAVMVLAALIFDRMHALLLVFCSLFCLVASCHTIGWLLNSTSMESVPFETGIKSIALSLKKMKANSGESKLE